MVQLDFFGKNFANRPHSHADLTNLTTDSEIKFFPRIKDLLVLLLVIVCVVSVKSQSTMTFGEVYDFEINDEFHSTNGSPSVPPNGQRVKIIGKYFSSTNDTVFYIKQNNNYSSAVDFSTNPPHLEYYFGTSVDTVSYTWLDSSVTISRPAPEELDSCNSYQDSLYNSDYNCQRLVFKSERCVDCCFEGQNFSSIIGKGIGLVRSDFTFPAESAYYNYTMFYYKKGNEECGNRDTTGTSGVSELIMESTRPVIHPNPCSEILNIDNIQNSSRIAISDMAGRIVLELNSNTNVNITVSDLPLGMYVVSVSNRNLNHFQRVFITD